MQFTLLLASTLGCAAAVYPPPSNPFCGLSTERNTVDLALLCVSGVMSIEQAFFGTPVGDCTRGFTASPTCDDPAFAAYAKAACNGKTNCTLSSQGPDPCGGIVKTIAAIATCSEAPGGYAPLPPPPSPTCALNGLPCPLPQWEPTWNLTQSTLIQPGGANYFMPAHPWGLISLDWSVASAVWYKGNRSNTTCEETSRTGCAMLKAAGKAHRCFICKSPVCVCVCV